MRQSGTYSGMGKPPQMSGQDNASAGMQTLLLKGGAYEYRNDKRRY